MPKLSPSEASRYYTRLDTEAKISELKQEIADIERSAGIVRVNYLLEKPQTRRKRKPMTAVQRKAVGERMRKYWAGQRKTKRVAVSLGLSARSASVEEQLAFREQVGSPFEPTHAFVAILDALGARSFSREQVRTFLESREPFWKRPGHSRKNISIASIHCV